MTIINGVELDDGVDEPTSAFEDLNNATDEDWITVWRVGLDRNSYVTDTIPSIEEAEGCWVRPEKMRRDDYENLPEFTGF